MSNQSLAGLVWLVVIAMPVGSACAQTQPQTHSCAAAIDPAERLACYDAAFPPTVDVADFQSAKARRDFGLNEAQLSEQVSADVRDATRDRIEARVAAVDHRPGGERVITLDSGQVWVFTEVTSKGHLEVGDEVLIRAAALGSYVLRTPGRASLRVRRVR